MLFLFSFLSFPWWGTELLHGDRGWQGNQQLTSTIDQDFNLIYRLRLQFAIWTALLISGCTVATYCSLNFLIATFFLFFFFKLTLQHVIQDGCRVRLQCFAHSLRIQWRNKVESHGLFNRLIFIGDIILNPTDRHKRWPIG